MQLYIASIIFVICKLKFVQIQDPWYKGLNMNIKKIISLQKKSFVYQPGSLCCINLEVYIECEPRPLQ